MPTKTISMKFFLSSCFFLFLFNLSAQQNTTWITNVSIVNTKDGIIQPGMTIVLKGDRIQQLVKYKATSKIPDSVQVIDGNGKYLMPGMIDGHIHFFQSGGLYTRPDAVNLGKFYSYEKDQQWIRDNHADIMRRYLAVGITTVVDVGGPLSNYEVKKQNESSTLMPNAWVTGPLISTYQPPNLDPKDPPIVKVNSEEEARALVRKQLPYKPDFIKIWYIVLPNQPATSTLPIIKAAIDESHKNGLKVCVHATEYETAKLSVEAGADILVHSVDDQLLDASFLQMMKQKKVTYIPTAIVASKYREVFSQQHRMSMHDFTYANPFVLGTLFDLQHLPEKETGFSYMTLRKQVKIPSKEDSVISRNMKLVADAGINVVAGTDAGNIGTQHASSFYTELLAMKDAGLTNEQILRSCTWNAAIAFGKETEVGSVSNGKLANLLLLNNNPFNSLEHVNDIAIVINRGQFIKPDTLLKVTAELLVQQQLNAYNARNIEAFLAPYSDSVELYEYPAKLIGKGKAQMREMYTDLFKKVTNLHCELVNRMLLGNTVIDYESVIGFGPKPVRAIAVYTIEGNKISKVRFIE
jgi:imidazolonepropionase-like amidohydrolase